MRSSKLGAALWGHPYLCGAIEVGSVLDPVITRDEFTRTPQRGQWLAPDFDRTLTSTLTATLT